MARIGIYGGSFNPVHEGHVLAAREFIRMLSLDTLLMIPAGIPPHKALADGSPDGQMRMALLESAVRDIPGITADDLELRREGRSYTFDTLAELRRKYPRDTLILLMGTDMFLSFRQWYRWDEILRSTPLAVLHRSADSPAQNDALAALAEEFRAMGAEVTVLDNSFVDVSSTEVRRMLFFGAGEGLVPERTLRLIRENGLYGVGADRRNLPFAALRELSLAQHDPKRVPHVLGCCETAVRLAQRWGENCADAARAGILHDVTKALSFTDQLLLCKKYAIMSENRENTAREIFHGKTAAAVARELFGENENVCRAIEWHTTGRAGMSRLEKILYLADYIEPNRAMPGLEHLRALAYSDLDAAMVCGLDMTLSYLREKGKIPDPASTEARAELAKGRNPV